MFRLALIASLLATPVVAEFTPIPKVSYCTNKPQDILDMFGVDIKTTQSPPNKGGVVMLEIETEQVLAFATLDKNKVFCIKWLLIKDETA